MKFWNKLNDKPLLKNAKDLVKLVEDNQHAEILMDKLNEIEHRYETVFAVENRYKILVNELVDNYNRSIREFPVSNYHLTIHENNDGIDMHSIEPVRTIIIFNLYNKFYFKIRNTIQMQLILKNYNPIEEAYKEIFYELSMKGMNELFTKKRNA